MFSGFNYALTLASLLILAVLFMPLIIFVWDFTQNPACLAIIPGEDVTPIGDNLYRVNITVSYCSSIELRDVVIQVGNITLRFPSLKKGNVTTEITVSLSDLEQAPTEGIIEASIAGLYRFSLNFKYGGRE